MSLPGLRTAAFFDLDYTLIRCGSGFRWVRFLRQRGEVSLLFLIKTLLWTLQYKLAILDLETVARRLVCEMAGDNEAQLCAKAALFLESEIRHQVSPHGLKALDWHRERQHVVVLLTSSMQYVAEPIASELGIEHVLCSRLLVDKGRFLGTCGIPLCYGAGKVHYAERFAAQNAIDLAGSYFYTDSYSDLPMLQRIGQPRIVNPDRRLLRHARQQGWPIARW